MKKIAFHTLGCKLNFAETSTLAREFKEAGYSVVGFSNDADVYVIHTCSVTAAAEKKCRQAIRQAKKRNSKALVAVIGCYSELRGNEIEESTNADIILGNGNKHKLLEYINKELADRHADISTANEFVPAWSTGDRTRSFLKIQDGCDYFCAYCTVPYARGRSRSTDINSIINTAQNIVTSGIKEIVLTGVNVGDFGKNNGENLAMLLKKLHSVEGLERLRISSIEPDLLSDEIIEITANSDIIAPHFHISLQSGSDNILKAMGRKYNTAHFADRVNKIKALIPRAFIAADVITGFPGETEDEFFNTETFLKNLPISELHVFTYSERPGTRAVTMTNRVQESLRTRRTAILLELSKQKKHDFYLLNKDSIHKVLWESTRNNGLMGGYTENYIRVKCKYNPTKANTIESITLTRPEFNEELFFHET